MFYRILTAILIVWTSHCMAEEIQFPVVDGQVFYPFTITTSGNYAVWGKVQALDESSNSLFLMVDGDTLDRIWDLPITTGFDWDQALIVNFSAGAHSISIRPREDGSKIRTIIISNDMDFVPNTWVITLGFKHDTPTMVAYFWVYLRRMDQTWQEGYKWRVENTLSVSDPDDEQDFTTPDIPADIYYCACATAVDYSGNESQFPYDPTDNAHTGWDCLFVRQQDMAIK